MTLIVLRSYQHDAVTFFMDNSRALLCDMPGMGKTHPAIEAAKCKADDMPKLVVAPAYLLPQWKDAITDYLGVFEPVRIVNRKDPPIPDGWPGWAIISYHTLMTQGVHRHPELLSTKWPVVIYDEVHRLRSRNAQWTKTAFKLKAFNTFGLTGTLIVNNPGDVWPILHIFDPQRFRSYWRFIDQWCSTEKTPWATEILGIKRGLEPAFNDMLDEFMLRRRIEDHLPELPPVIEHHLSVELPPPVKKMHDKLKKDWFIEHPSLDEPLIVQSGGALVAKLRQLTAGVLKSADGVPLCKPDQRVKTQTVLDLLDDHPNEPVIVFSWFRATAEDIGYALACKTPLRPVSVLTGDAAPNVRARYVDYWKTQPNGVISATMSSLQEGANLQHARMVVFVEEDYLPASVEQAIARLHRFGQAFPVNCYFVRAKGTIDDAVARVRLRRERANLRALLEDLQH